MKCAGGSGEKSADESGTVCVRERERRERVPVHTGRFCRGRGWVFWREQRQLRGESGKLSFSAKSTSITVPEQASETWMEDIHQVVQDLY